MRTVKLVLVKTGWMEAAYIGAGHGAYVRFSPKSPCPLIDMPGGGTYSNTGYLEHQMGTWVTANHTLHNITIICITAATSLDHSFDILNQILILAVNQNRYVIFRG